MGFLSGAKIYLFLAVLVICLICLAIISRQWSCRQHRPPRPPRPPHRETLSVVSVPTGASIVCKGRRRETTVTLADIGAPQEGAPLADESRASLERLAGKTITLEAGRRSTDGTVYGESGINCNLEQLRLGFAWLQDVTVPAAWAAAQRDAKKNRRGIWGGTK